MKNIVPKFDALLKAYVRREMGFGEFHDQLSLRLQTIFEKSSEDGLDLLSEVQACVYEVEDGVMPEAAFRQAVAKFLKPPRGRRTVTSRRRGRYTMARRPRRVQRMQRANKMAIGASSRIRPLSRGRALLPGYR